MVGTLPGFEVIFIPTGTPPIHTKIRKNATMLSIAAASGAAVKFHEEGNYTCVASSPHGSYSKVFSVMFRGGT